MEETLGYNDNERMTATPQWQMGGTSALSFETKGSTIYLQSQKNNLHLVQKKQTPSNRPTIPATRPQKLAYYRCQVTSPSKTQIICMQHVRFNRFLWYYIFNLFFKSLPHTYVYIFLASYAAEEHFFLPKMVPVCWGLNIVYIITAIMEIFCYIDNAIFLLDYAICGILYKNPWNRCDKKSTYIENLNITVNCYVLEEFSKKFESNSTVFRSTFYATADEEYFQLASIDYFKRRIAIIDNWNYSYMNLYFIFMWLLVAISYKALFKKYIWVHLYRVQLALNIMYMAVFVHLVLDSFLGHLDRRPEITSTVDELTQKMWKADVDMLAESMTTPPVVHILTARSVDEIEPSRDSAVILMSNAIYFIFRGLLSYKKKKYCEALTGAPIYLTDFNQHSFLYFWPMYFSSFYLGNIYTNVFFLLNFLVETFVVIITYECLIEAIVCEWKMVKRMPLTCTIIVGGIIPYYLSTIDTRMIFLVYSKSIVTLAEVIGIYILYPLGRLVDDITFHHGVAPSKLRILNLRFVPIFYTIKIYTLFDALEEVLQQIKFFEMYPLMKWSFLLVLTPIFLGLIHAIVKNKNAGNDCWALFCPKKDFGPRDFTVRQWRKLYDSREYVGSQAAKLLTRYMMSKAESKAYELDIKYNPSRYSTFDSAIRIEKENKEF
ncbi:uncharacterized protein LOC113523088 [Galleria mellonella]|uniref:Uncharacterized protein LOC113523088 n=1 Tax=Galleria mellonella TaxID=7137 RepID=A0ABM3MW76_GALME|nr:uncharacterized protein LOC113523088 [Galleria mellonella]